MFLLQKQFFDSRNKASEAIKSGKVKVDGKEVLKPSFEILGDEEIEVVEKERYVSRAAYKLLSLLKYHDVDFRDKRILDVGASTGGFTQVALEFGAKEVVCVDVGRSQLHRSIKNETRVKSFEECDIRSFSDKEGFDIVLCDVSFISVTYIADALSALSKGVIITLFKPQFEVGKGAKRDKNGVVLDQNEIDAAKNRVIEKFEKLGWNKIYEQFSEVSGKEGNREIFLCFEDGRDKRACNR